VVLVYDVIEGDGDGAFMVMSTNDRCNCQFPFQRFARAAFLSDEFEIHVNILYEIYVKLK
jgi:hypothetical protein